MHAERTKVDACCVNQLAYFDNMKTSILLVLYDFISCLVVVHTLRVIIVTSHEGQDPKTPADWFFVQKSVQANNKENTKALN